MTRRATTSSLMASRTTCPALHPERREPAAPAPAPVRAPMIGAATPMVATPRTSPAAEAAATPADVAARDGAGDGGELGLHCVHVAGLEGGQVAVDGGEGVTASPNDPCGLFAPRLPGDQLDRQQQRPRPSLDLWPERRGGCLDGPALVGGYLCRDRS